MQGGPGIAQGADNALIRILVLASEAGGRAFAERGGEARPRMRLASCTRPRIAPGSPWIPLGFSKPIEAASFAPEGRDSAPSRPSRPRESRPGHRISRGLTASLACRCLVRSRIEPFGDVEVREREVCFLLAQRVSVGTERACRLGGRVTFTWQ